MPAKYDAVFTVRVVHGENNFSNSIESNADQSGEMHWYSWWKKDSISDSLGLSGACTGENEGPAKEGVSWVVLWLYVEELDSQDEQSSLVDELEGQ